MKHPQTRADRRFIRTLHPRATGARKTVIYALPIKTKEIEMKTKEALGVLLAPNFWSTEIHPVPPQAQQAVLLTLRFQTASKQPLAYANGTYHFNNGVKVAKRASVFTLRAVAS